MKIKGSNLPMKNRSKSSDQLALGVRSPVSCASGLVHYFLNGEIDSVECLNTKTFRNHCNPNKEYISCRYWSFKEGSNPSSGSVNTRNIRDTREHALIGKASRGR